MPSPLPWETFKADEPLSYLNTGLGVLGLPGEYFRGLLAGKPGDRMSGEELAQHYGWQDPGMLGGMAVGMATDPLMLAGPAMGLARGIMGGAKVASAAGEAASAARSAVPFLHSAAFNIGAPLAGAGLYDLNREYGNPAVDVVASGLMAAPLATMGAGMVMKGARKLRGPGETPPPVVHDPTPEVDLGRRNFLKQMGATAATAAINPMELAEGLAGAGKSLPGAAKAVAGHPNAHLLWPGELLNGWMNDSFQYGHMPELQDANLFTPTMSRAVRRLEQLEAMGGDLRSQYHDLMAEGRGAEAQEIARRVGMLDREMVANNQAFFDSLVAAQNTPRQPSGRPVGFGPGTDLVPYEAPKPSEGVLPVGRPPLEQMFGSPQPTGPVPLPAPVYAPPTYSRLDQAARALAEGTVFKGRPERVQPGRPGRPEKVITLPDGTTKVIPAQPDVPAKVIPGNTAYDQMVGMLHKGAPEGVSEEEIETVLKRALAGQDEITVDQVMDAIRANGINVERKVLAQNPLQVEQAKLWKELQNKQRTYEASQRPLNPGDWDSPETIASRQSRLEAMKRELDAAQTAYDAHPITQAAARLTEAEKKLDKLKAGRSDALDSAVNDILQNRGEKRKQSLDTSDYGYARAWAYDRMNAREMAADPRLRRYGNKYNPSDDALVERYMTAEKAAKQELPAAQAEHAVAQEAFTKATGADSVPRWTNLTPPGGSNPREVLLKVPDEGLSPQAKNYNRLVAIDNGIVRADPNNPYEAGLAEGRYLLPSPEPGVLNEINAKQFAHPHYPNEISGNILAEPRVDDRVNARGGKDLFVLELQSDLHQAGRKGGYRGADYGKLQENNRRLQEITKTINKLYDAGARNDDPRILQLQAEEHSIGDYKAGLDMMPPDVPFKDNRWLDLSLKHVMDMAVKEGYDSISFTTGDIAKKYVTGGGSTTKAMRKWYDEIVQNRIKELFPEATVVREPLSGLPAKMLSEHGPPNDFTSEVDRVLTGKPDLRGHVYRIYLPKVGETPAGQTLAGRIRTKGQPMLSLSPFGESFDNKLNRDTDATLLGLPWQRMGYQDLPGHVRGGPSGDTLRRAGVHKLNKNRVHYTEASPIDIVRERYENAPGGVEEALRLAQELPQGDTGGVAPFVDYGLAQTPLPVIQSPRRVESYGQRAAGMVHRARPATGSPPTAIIAPWSKDSARQVLEHEATHLYQRGGSSTPIAEPMPDLGLDEHALRPIELDAMVAAPARRLFAQWAGRHVANEADAANALDLLASGKGVKSGADALDRTQIDAINDLRNLMRHPEWESTIRPYLLSRVPRVLSLLPFLAGAGMAGAAAQQQNQ